MPSPPAPDERDGAIAAIERLRGQARGIWEAAIAAVDPEELLARSLAVDEREDGALLTCLPGETGASAWSVPPIPLDRLERIVVVGGGKAAAGLAAGVESLLGSGRLSRHAVSGLVSVPQGCGRRLAHIAVRETRPAGENLPTPAVVEATGEMLAELGTLGPDDLAVVLLSGGGSALVESPRPGVSLDDTIARTSLLSRRGATIGELNAARSRLSLVKGGGLAGAATAGRLLVILLSDVVGDDPRVIASGPCMPPDGSARTAWTTDRGCSVSHCLVGGNTTAVEAAARAAGEAGYEVRVRRADPSRSSETAAGVGHRLAAEGLRLVADARRLGRPLAILEGGEAVVRLPADHGRGGRNQQTVIVAAQDILACGCWPAELLVASIGTDGEDGPTDAAGGLFDAGVARAIQSEPRAAGGAAAGADSRGAGGGRWIAALAAAVARHDAYPLLQSAGGLIRTGPTGTNVADLRIVLAGPSQRGSR